MSSFYKSMISAVASGISTALLMVQVVPVKVSTDNLLVLGYMVLIGAGIGLANFFAQSPWRKTDSN